MTLIKSISGIRGTIGGEPGKNLTPPDVVRFAAAFGLWLINNAGKSQLRVVIGRDGRITGEMVTRLVSATLAGLGIDVIDLGLASTPTVELAVTGEKADGGVIITASHNPKEWNALKLLNHEGEFINASDGEEILNISENEKFDFSRIETIGKIINLKGYAQEHIRKVLEMKLVDQETISKANLSVAVDGINSVGGIIIPELLKQLGVTQIFTINCIPDGHFAHDPEPLPGNLTGLSGTVTSNHADVGIAVDPDVDRLALVCEDGSFFGEEYTLVAVSDYILQHTPGSTVSNLSSSRALRDLTEAFGMQYFTCAVGEVNVVEKMKKVNAVVGGEGNGGIIYPELHYGRDALVGVALFLTYLVRSGLKCSELRGKYPDYYITKKKIELKTEISTLDLFHTVKEKYRDHTLNEEDGLKIEFPDGWIHLRKSNTEAVIRVIAESTTKIGSEELSGEIFRMIQSLIE